MVTGRRKAPRPEMVQAGESGKSGRAGFKVGAGGKPRARAIIELLIREAEVIFRNTMSETETVRRMRRNHHRSGCANTPTPRPKVLDDHQKHGTPICCPGIASSTVNRYLDVIKERWGREYAEQKPGLVESHRQMLIQLRADASADKKWSAAIKAEEVLSRIDGVLAPDRHEHLVMGNLGVGKTVLDGMTPEELARFAETGELPDDPVRPPGANGAAGPAVPSGEPN